MTITIEQDVTPVTITLEQSSNTVVVNPVVCKAGEGFDGIVDGGTP